MMQPARESSRRATFSLMASLGVLSTTGLSLGTHQNVPGVPVAAREASRHSDEQLRALILGRWRTESNGTRVVDNRADGTASMDVRFDFVASLLYGDHMTLDLHWTVHNGVLVYTIQSGSPQATVDRIISAYGDQASYHFRSIGEKRMHLERVIDADEDYVWTRVD
jgi:hypothetical protein